MKFSSERAVQAANFIKQHGRPLDAARYSYHFENGRSEDVVTELAKFQNEDGGFGHGIEPDFRMADSSPMATSVGLQICVEIGLTEAHPMVQQAMGYLRASYNHTHNYWPATSAAVNDAPHAPWWHVQKTAPPETDAWANPSAELAGYVAAFEMGTDEEMMAYKTAVLHTAQQNLAAQDNLGWFYNLLCWERAAYLVDTDFQKAIYAKLHTSYEAMLPITSDSLRELPVFAIAKGPDSLFAQVVGQKNMEMLLAHAIGRQADDGAWWPGWQWGQYEDVWPVARQEWAGAGTLEALHVLHHFGLW